MINIKSSFKHLAVGVTAGVICRLLLYGLDAIIKTFAVANLTESLSWFCIVAWFLICIVFELYQHDINSKKDDYWQRKKWDTVLDIIFGVVGFALPMLFHNPIL